MARRWLLAARRPEVETALASELGVSPLLARLLVNRELTTPAAATAFLSAKLAEHLRSPMLFRDMARAAERVVVALRAGEQVGIYGDYDVDGISGSAVLLTFLRALGHEPLLHIPHRLRDGYGVTEPGVRRLAEQGARLMITVDCGAVAHREVALASELGMEVIVCDHHQVSGTRLPAYAVLNPIEPDGGFPFAGLCGAGVAFYLALGVRMCLREAGVEALPDLRRYLDLVTLGTIADIVPLLEENRVLVKHGLRELAQSSRPGIMALKTVSGVGRVTTGTVGFRLAPRLNAGGRLADAVRSVELLTTADAGRAEQLAQALDQENRARQAIEIEILTDAVERIESRGDADRCSIVLASPEWHPGVIGIVASRLVERYYRPTLLIALNQQTGIGRGSGRSIRHFNLHEAVKACGGVLEGFGGHRMAVGLSIRRERVEEFAELFEQAVRANTRAEHFTPEIAVDAELALCDIDDAVLADLEQLEPFGMGNPEPIFCTRAVTVLSRRIVGEKHLKLYLKHGERALPAIGFGMANRDIADAGTIDILYSPAMDEWNGNTSLQLRLRDLRPARA
ncbi:MAG: single-stranded-DNA-specific exonuclease RecJ [Deltaproteobacteria bacterium]|nr:single-stranded-DNA-specific exonuclease RecJ [Deltaproteobacteria bacterium]